MVVDTDTPVPTDQVFRALSDPTRRDIVSRTLHDEQSVSGLARHYPMSFAAVQKHVALLERAQLVTKRRRGREQLVRANAGTLQGAHDSLARLESEWRSRLDRFDQLLTEYLNEGDMP
jgi:DNA-binding transcriptional ArsR family regulator